MHEEYSIDDSFKPVQSGNLKHRLSTHDQIGEN